jgi:AcrR family transcriptional regulator
MNKILNRQKEIIDASFELISEKGIQGLTIKNLSKKIGLVESAIYRHFENKTQILTTILDSIDLQPKDYGEIKTESIMDLIANRLGNHFRFFTEKPVLVSIVFAEDLFQNESLLVEKTRLKIEKSISELSGLIKKGQENGEIRTDIMPEIISIMINGSMRMLVKQWKMTGYSFDLIGKGNLLIESLKSILKQ